MDGGEWKENHLTNAVGEYFTELGYTVRHEVKNCDVVAWKEQASGKTIIIVETKLTFNLKLLYQAVNRLELSEEVYIAFLRPTNLGRRSNWKNIKKLTGQLGVGILLITGKKDFPLIQLAKRPHVNKRKINLRRRQSLEKELIGRKVSGQEGGIRQTKILTAYRELSISLAVYLKKYGEERTKNLYLKGFPKSSGRILLNNHYNWFIHKGRGLYDFDSNKMKEIKMSFNACWKYYQKKWTKEKRI